MTFRTGRHVGRTIYAMLDDEPGDGDQLVGMMDTPDLADRVVRGLNALPLESRPMPHAERCDQPGGHDPHDYDVDAPAGQWRHCDGAAPADEPVSVPPPVDPMKEWTRELLSRARADKAAPVSPPVDALLNRVDEIAFHADRIARADMSGARDKVDLHDAHYRRERAALRTDLGALWAAGVEEGRRQATEDLTSWLDQLAARLPQYNSELSVCTRRANAQVLGAYERAATIARSGLDRNPHCSTCGDTRGGPRGHETSECTWDMWRWPDLLAVPRDVPDGQDAKSTEERCDLPGEHEPHDYDVDAPAGEWRHCDGATGPEVTRG